MGENLNDWKESKYHKSVAFSVPISSSASSSSLSSIQFSRMIRGHKIGGKKSSKQKRKKTRRTRYSPIYTHLSAQLRNQNMTSFPLSTGALKQAFSKDGHDKVKCPLVFQVTNLKSVNTMNNLKKYRILLSDGVYSTQGIIEEKCTPYLENNNWSRYCTIQVNAFRTLATAKHFLIIEDVEILTPTGEKPTTPLINIDTYFAEHPEEAALTVTKKQNSVDEKEQIPSTTNTPPVAQSTASSIGAAPASSTTTATATKQQYPPLKGVGQPAPARISPIETISPYQNTWTIKARVSYKGELRSWSNAKGEGKVFSINFLDESDEIKASAFNESAERAYNLLEEGKVYYISKAKVGAARKKFNNLTHPYELTLEKDTEITECFDESDVPKLNFNFVKLDKIQNLEPNAIVDVLGALKVVNPPFQITAKSTGKAFDRRDITIVDETGFAVDVGLWNNTAVDFSVEEGTVIAFKGCKVSDFNGRSLSLTQAGSIVPNPGTPESYQLKGWFDNVGVKENFKSMKTETNASSSLDRLANRKTIAQVEEETNNNIDGGDQQQQLGYFTVKACFSFTKPENFAYPACTNIVSNNTDSSKPGLPCNKKLVEVNDKWRCERCDLSYDEPTYRYILYISITDATGQLWTTLFDEQAKKLLGIDANELMKLSLPNESHAVAEYISRAYFKEYNFRLRVKQDTFNDQLKLRYQCVGLSDIDYNTECEFLCSELDALLG